MNVTREDKIKFILQFDQDSVDQMDEEELKEQLMNMYEVVLKKYMTDEQIESEYTQYVEMMEEMMEE